jgi:hypothetical protein
LHRASEAGGFRGPIAAQLPHSRSERVAIERWPAERSKQAPERAKKTPEMPKKTQGLKNSKKRKKRKETIKTLADPQKTFLSGPYSCRTKIAKYEQTQHKETPKLNFGRVGSVSADARSAFKKSEMVLLVLHHIFLVRQVPKWRLDMMLEYDPFYFITNVQAHEREPCRAVLQRQDPLEVSRRTSSRPSVTHTVVPETVV